MVRWSKLQLTLVVMILLAGVLLARIVAGDQGLADAARAANPGGAAQPSLSRVF